MRVLIKNDQKKIKVDIKRLEGLAQAILKDVRSHDCEISLLLTDNPGIQELNRQYLGKNCPTDVLSFSMGDGEFRDLNPHILGDVVISVECAGELSEDRGITLDTMIAGLLIHGILHLHGYDHEKRLEDAKIMEREEDRLLSLVKGKKILDG